MRSHARIEVSGRNGGGPWLRRGKWSGEMVCIIVFV